MVMKTEFQLIVLYGVATETGKQREAQRSMEMNMGMSGIQICYENKTTTTAKRKIIFVMFNGFLFFDFRIS